MMLLMIIAPPAVEHALIDWLLMQEGLTGFTSQVASGYGSGHTLSIAEQVTGRRKQISFTIALNKTTADTIITELKLSFSGTGLHYWLMPLSQSGSI